MSIKTVKTEELRRMNGSEGLILQGCGGDPQEWLDGINGLLADEGILKNGSRVENISVFHNGDLTNILFPFEDGVDIDSPAVRPFAAGTETDLFRQSLETVRSRPRPKVLRHAVLLCRQFHGSTQHGA